MSQNQQQRVPQFQLILTEGDKKNLCALLNRVGTQGIQEAEMLVNCVTAIQNAAPWVEPAVAFVPKEKQKPVPKKLVQKKKT